MIRGIEHTAIASPDPANLADWYVVFFTDPEGNLLHLLQRASPLP